MSEVASISGEPRRLSIHKKLALVTGASSGIGAAAAKALAAVGYRVILVARRASRLTSLEEEIVNAGGEAVGLAVDLTREEERARLVEEIRARHGPVDVLVNSAGLGWYGYGADMPWDLAREILAVNAAALVHLTLAFLPEMRRRGCGYIINISSIAGSLPNQGVAVYSATKALVDAFSTALHRETRGSGVCVSVVKPGPVATEFYAAAASRPAGRPVPAERFAVAPERVARRIVTLLRKPRRVAYIPRFLAFAPWVEPLFGWGIDRLGPLLLRHPPEKGGRRKRP